MLAWSCRCCNRLGVDCAHFEGTEGRQGLRASKTEIECSWAVARRASSGAAEASGRRRASRLPARRARLCFSCDQLRGARHLKAARARAKAIQLVGGGGGDGGGRGVGKVVAETAKPAQQTTKSKGKAKATVKATRAKATQVSRVIIAPRSPPPMISGNRAGRISGDRSRNRKKLQQRLLASNPRRKLNLLALLHAAKEAAQMCAKVRPPARVAGALASS